MMVAATIVFYGAVAAAAIIFVRELRRERRDRARAIAEARVGTIVKRGGPLHGYTTPDDA